MKRDVIAGSFSKIFLGFVLTVFFIDTVIGHYLTSEFAIYPNLVLQKYQFWRILSYPFAVNSIESVFLFFAAFALYSCKLEEFLHTKLYPVLLFLVIMLHGILHTIFYWQSTIPLAGLEGTSIFVILLMTLLKPASKIKFYKWREVKAAHLSIIILLLWMIIKTTNSLTGGPVHVASFLSPALFGSVFGFTTFAQIRLFQNYWKKKSEKILTDLKLPRPEELSMAVMSNTRLRKYYSSYDEEAVLDTFILSDNPEENEEKLNEILDKINEQGKPALTKNELRFLDEYSKYIK